MGEVSLEDQSVTELAPRRPPGDVNAALREAIAAGLERYLPRAIGLFLTGFPMCGMGAFCHFVLGASAVATSISAATGTGVALGLRSAVASARHGSVGSNR